MGIELEWFVLLVVHVIGTSVFGRFEAETPWWRLVLKWSVVIALTGLAYRLAGHWALLVVIIPAVGGGTFHVIWCRRNGIHPLRATPRRRYYELRGWSWPA
ncbi:MAG TPA: hypothetical protein VKB18_10115 [Gemmatimonadota bacterium]|nr:hypothetical protein [Gemmatimonadota bacterium]